jgi:hypothetical protein
MPAPTTRGTASVDGALLDKVRALLAKAESTAFPAEADALNDKAQQLMARHAIDQAMVEGRATSGDVRSLQVVVHAPYAKARFLLLSAVARSCHCLAVWQQDLGSVTVFGFPAELDAVELLYTSLLMQATTAMVGTNASYRRGTQVAAFRRAFLTSYAQRVGVRLRAAADAAAAEARVEHGDSLLPVLANRDSAVQAALKVAMPNTRQVRASVSDAGGWSAGQKAADRAALSNQAGITSPRGAISRH